MFMPRRNVRLSPWKSVRLRKLMCAMFVASYVFVRVSVVMSGHPFSMCDGGITWIDVKDAFVCLIYSLNRYITRI